MTTPAALRELADRFKDVIDTNMMDGTARRTLHKLVDELRTAASEGGPSEVVAYQWLRNGKPTGGWFDGVPTERQLQAQKQCTGVAEWTVKYAYSHPPEVARDAGLVTVPREPTESQWSGLARDVIMWMNAYDRHSSETLLKHLERSGTEIPDWLRKEADTGPHSLPKGSIAAIIYKAMIADAPQAAISGAAGVG